MAIPSGAAAQAALARARTFLGYREEPPRSNRTRFGKQYGWDGVAWCVMFVWCMLQDTGSSAGMLKTASTGAAETWGKSVGRFTRTPHVGDLLILRNASGATIHTELVYSWSSGRLLGIGGNTSGGPGSIADGGTVAINDRTALYRAGRITFVRPFYGVTTDDVKTIQRATGVAVDGVIGPQTVSAVRAFQAEHGLTVDGFPGPATMAALLPATAGPAGGMSKPVPAKPAVQRLVVDGRLGTDTVRALQTFLNAGGRGGGKITVDGKAGPATWRALQTYLGTPVDGKVSKQGRTASSLGNGVTGGWEYTGPGSSGSTMVRALQKWIRVTQDGIWGPATTRALQVKLREHGA